MAKQHRLVVALLTGLFMVPTTPALADTHWQMPLWLEWFAPQPASVDPLEGKTGGINGPNMTLTDVQGSTQSTGQASRIKFAAGTAPAAAAPGSNVPPFRKPEHPKRPDIKKPETPKLSWGAERHPRPPKGAPNGGGNGKARKFTPTERPLLTLPSGKEAWNTYRPDGSGTIDIKNPRPGTPKPRWAAWQRP